MSSGDYEIKSYARQFGHVYPDHRGVTRDGENSLEKWTDDEALTNQVLAKLKSLYGVSPDQMEKLSMDIQEYKHSDGSGKFKSGTPY